MPYVSRDAAGKINGTFELLQPGLAEELLPDNDPQIVALTAPSLLDVASDARKAHEFGGITVNGAPIGTDDVSQAKLAAAYSCAQRDANWSTVWKTGPGTFITVNATQMIATAIAVSMHVETCFAKEAEVCGLIKSGAITTAQQITDAFNSIPKAYTA